MFQHGGENSDVVQYSDRASHMLLTEPHTCSKVLEYQQLLGEDIILKLLLPEYRGVCLANAESMSYGKSGCKIL